MTALLVALLLGHGADAGITDIPVQEGVVLGETQLVSVKAVFPGDEIDEPGVFLSEEAALMQARRIRSCEAERGELRNMPSVPPWMMVAAFAAGAATVGLVWWRTTQSPTRQ